MTVSLQRPGRSGWTGFDLRTRTEGVGVTGGPSGRVIVEPHQEREVQEELLQPFVDELVRTPHKVERDVPAVLLAPV